MSTAILAVHVGSLRMPANGPKLASSNEAALNDAEGAIEGSQVHYKMLEVHAKDGQTALSRAPEHIKNTEANMNTHYNTPMLFKQADASRGDNLFEDTFFTATASEQQAQKGQTISYQLATAEPGPQWEPVAANIKDIIHVDPSDPDGPLGQIQSFESNLGDLVGNRDLVKTMGKAAGIKVVPE